MSYIPYGLTLTNLQKQSLGRAIQDKTNITLRLSNDQLHGDDKLALTQSQINKIAKHKNENIGMNLKLTKTQLQKMKKMGGFLPLIPLILAGLSALGGLAGGAASIAKTVQDKQANAAALEETQRHNREVEKQLQGSGISCCPKCRGSGLYLSKNG